MEYHKTINLLDNTLNEPSKFRTRNWVETIVTKINKLNFKLQ